VQNLRRDAFEKNSKESSNSDPRDVRYLAILTRGFGRLPLKIFVTIPILILLTPIAGNTADASQNTNVQAWATTMKQTPTPGVGCYEASYPNNTWTEVQCKAPPNIRLNVGNGYNEFPTAPSGTLIGYSSGLFNSINGFTQEFDTWGYVDYYTLQLNTQKFSISYSSHPAVAWQQFAFFNPGSNIGGVFMQYWLLGYYHDWGFCPAAPVPLSGFYQSGNDCYANSPTTSLSASQPASNLIHMSLAGSANFGSSNDEVVLCISGTCWSKSVQDSVFNLANYWQKSEFNVLGYDVSAPTAFFNKGTSITIWDSLETGTGTVITPSCNIGGVTYETNNLTLGNCSVSPSGTLSFSER
jgi:hypothetical protein